MARRNPAGTTAITKWDEQMAKYAEEAKAVTGKITGGFISLQGGIIKIDKTPVPDNTLDVIVMDHIFENGFYEGKFDPEDPVPPVCFALGREEESLAPHELSSNPQSETCAECPHNEWASSDTGRGKACKNQRRLALVSADAIEGDLLSTEIRYLKTPVTSSSGWDSYVTQAADTMHLPPFALVTEITTVQDSKTQFKLVFKCKEKIAVKGNAQLEEDLIAKHEEAAKKIDFPYQPLTEEDHERRQAQARRQQFTRGGRRKPVAPPAVATPARGARTNGAAITRGKVPPSQAARMSGRVAPLPRSRKYTRDEATD